MTIWQCGQFTMLMKLCVEDIHSISYLCTKNKVWFTTPSVWKELIYFIGAIPCQLVQFFFKKGTTPSWIFLKFGTFVGTIELWQCAKSGLKISKFVIYMNFWNFEVKMLKVDNCCRSQVWGHITAKVIILDSWNCGLLYRFVHRLHTEEERKCCFISFGIICPWKQLREAMLLKSNFFLNFFSLIIYVNL